MIFEHMDRIVFAGDSVTDMESAQPRTGLTFPVCFGSCMALG